MEGWKNGILEWWNIGMIKYWNIGKMEYWKCKKGRVREKVKRGDICPLLQVWVNILITIGIIHDQS